MSEITRRPSRLKLVLNAPASPERVALATRMLADAVYASNQDLEEADVTLVVDNFRFEAELRGRTPDGRRALRHIERVLRNPMAAIRARPLSASIAETLSEHASEFAPLGAVFMKRKVIASIDDLFERSMKAAAAAPYEEARVRVGTASVHSRIHRIGRANVKADIRVRIDLDGQQRDVPVDDDALSECFTAVRHGGVCRLTLAAEWLPDEDGVLRFMSRRTRVLHVEMPTGMYASGFRFLSQVRELAPELSRRTDLMLDELERMDGDPGDYE